MSLSKKSSKIKGSKKNKSKTKNKNGAVSKNMEKESKVNQGMIEKANECDIDKVDKKIINKVDEEVISKANEDVVNEPPIGTEEYGKLVREKYKDTVSEVKILPDDLYESICRRDRIIESITELKNEKDVIEHTIMNLMKENDMAFVKNRKITWKNVSRTTFDSKLLKVEEPETYEKYCKTTSSRVFKIR